MKPKWYDGNIENLIGAILKLRNKHEAIDFLTDLMTISEIKMFSSRFLIAQMIQKGLSYNEIEKLTGTSSATIAKISKNFKYGSEGYTKIIARLKNNRNRS